MTAPAQLAQCAHCHGVIKRNGTRWVHTDSGRKSCGTASVYQARPRMGQR